MALDSAWYGLPVQVTPAPVDGLLSTLPYLGMLPADFEKLLWRIVDEVEGLRHVHLYGTHGQKDYGVDVVGQLPDGTWHGWQGKRYNSYTPGDLTTAVQDHTGVNTPFPVTRLVIAVPCPIKSQVVDRLRTLQSTHSTLEIVLVGPEDLDERLRRRQDIVTTFFGAHTAARFCRPAPQPAVITAPGLDRSAFADAARNSPARSCGAELHLEQAALLSQDGEHAAAADQYQRAQDLLAAAGFAGHASAVGRSRAGALIDGGLLGDGAQLLSDAFWPRADTGDSYGTAMLLGQLSEAVRAQQGKPQERGHDTALRLLSLMDTGRYLSQPLADLGRVSDRLADSELARHHPVEHARLAALAAETALARQDLDWLGRHTAVLSQAAAAVAALDHALLSVRLRAAVADSTGDWRALLSAARRRVHSRILCALILARHARYLAVTAGSAEAADSWEEAVELACLDSHNADAADWVYATRLIRDRTDRQRLFGDEHHLAQALLARPGKPLLLKSGDLLAQGIGDLHEGNLRAAVIALTQQVRISIATGRWLDEHVARRSLAEALQASGEFDQAAVHAVMVGESTPAERLTAAVGEHFTDVTDRLGKGPYWERAIAMRLTADQADLLPDSQVSSVAEQTLALLEATGTTGRGYIPAENPSPYLAAHGLLAGVAPRLDLDQAARALDCLRPLTVRGIGGVRRTDDTHTAALAAVARTHPDLRDGVLDQLLTMVASGNAMDTALRSAAETFTRYGGHLQPQLLQLAQQGSQAASRILMDGRLVEPPGPDQLEQAAAALIRITAPPETSTGPITTTALGTSALQDAALVQLLPEEDRMTAIDALINAGRGSGHSMERGERIDAAINLAARMPKGGTVAAAYPTVIAALSAPAVPSPGDDAFTGTSHPLDFFRFNVDLDDIRCHWVRLAAVLANAPEQHHQVRDQILLLLPGAEGNDAYYLARALQALPTAVLVPHLFLLASHPSWAVRCICALAWAREESSSLQLGPLLAHDRDVRVRRTLAEAIGESRYEYHRDTAEHLAKDPHYSVRQFLHA